ncbi:MAG TPA: malto-oligosyltrehalose synthase [Candidatus Acidoferrales bacterium]
MAPVNIPLTCYRLQMNGHFTFLEASKIIGYLERLGITTIYSSPILQSRAGSEHGYDVTDPTRIDSELGGEQQFESFQTELRRRGMSILLDIVPNHMAARPENPWWMDVLENGPGSVYSSYFDIDWHPPSRLFENKILLPILGGFYADTLKKGELKLVFHEGQFFIQYFESSFPLAPKTYLNVLRHQQQTLEAKLGASSPAYQEYLGIVVGLEHLAPRETLPVYAAGDRRLQVAALKERLKELYANDPTFRKFLDSNIQLFNGQHGSNADLNALDRLLSEQSYALSFWNGANAEINYRRFFNVAELIGVRVEDPTVMNATHGTIFRLLESGAVAGLRIDHIDGLHDPLGYLQRLQNHATVSGGNGGHTSDVYLIVEKILSGTEHLPSEWPVSGTTGYEFLNALNRLFVHPEGIRRMAKGYFKFIGKEPGFANLLYEKKKLIMTSLLAVEMRYLGHQLSILAQQDRYARELPGLELAHAFAEVTACLPVYRTYIRGMEAPQHAKHYIEQALDEARSRNPLIDEKYFQFVRDVLLGSDAEEVSPEQREARLGFVMRWQQLTGAIEAKGLEDTLLYVYYPLLSLNDVGGDPRPTNGEAGQFYDFVHQRQRREPHGLNSTATHDTKRGEDVRARINVLAEIPEEWNSHLKRWARFNAKSSRVIDGQKAPDRNEEIFIYQTLVGAWPLDEKELPDFRVRMREYVLKSAREAKVHTRWVRQNPKQEKALDAFVSAILTTSKPNRFLDDFREFHCKIAYFGMLNGLAQMLIKITSPGIPEIYQGNELWDLRLVDPDNRRPIDYGLREKLLNEIAQHKPGAESIEPYLDELRSEWRDGRIKLYALWKVLNFRRRNASLFLNGSFEPLQVMGPRARNVVAYARKHKNESAIVVAPKWLAYAKAPLDWREMSRFWADTKIILPKGNSGQFLNVLTNDELRADQNRGRSTLNIAQLLKSFPVACAASGTQEITSLKSKESKLDAE